MAFFDIEVTSRVSLISEMKDKNYIHGFLSHGTECKAIEYVSLMVLSKFPGLENVALFEIFRLCKGSNVLKAHELYLDSIVVHEHIIDLCSWIEDKLRSYPSTISWFRHAGGMLILILRDIGLGIVELHDLSLCFGGSTENIAVGQSGAMVAKGFRPSPSDFKVNAQKDVELFRDMIITCAAYPLIKDGTIVDNDKLGEILTEFGWPSWLHVLLNQLNDLTTLNILPSYVFLDHPALFDKLSKRTYIRKLCVQIFFEMEDEPYFHELSTKLFDTYPWKKNAGEKLKSGRVQRVLNHKHEKTYRNLTQKTMSAQEYINSFKDSDLFGDWIKVFWDGERHMLRLKPNGDNYTVDEILDIIEDNVGDRGFTEIPGILMLVWGAIIKDGRENQHDQVKVDQMKYRQWCFQFLRSTSLF